jgi:WD40 repeat protein
VTGGGWRSTAETNCGAYVWDESTGRLLSNIQAYANVTFAGAIRPDGKMVALSSRDGRARLFDMNGPKPLFEQRQPVPIGAANFSPDGRLLLTGGGRGNRGQAQLWNVTTGALANPPCDFEAPVVAVAFDPDGRTAVAGTRKGAIQVWDAATGQSVGPIQMTPPKLDPRVAALPTALDPGSRILMLFGREDARWWEPAAGRPSASLPVLDKNVTAVAFSPDGQTVLIGDMGKTIRLWDVATGQFRGERRAAGAIPWHIAFNPDGSRFLTVTGDSAADWGKVQIWDTATATPSGPPLPPRVAVTAVAFHPDGRTIAAGGRDGDVRFWDGPTGKSLGPPLNHSGAVRAVAFDKAGQRLAVAGADGTIRVWPVSEPMSGTPTEVRRSIEKLTGHELDSNDRVRPVNDAKRPSTSGT